MLDEGIGKKFGSYMSNQHFLKPYLIIIAKERRVQGTNRVAPSVVIVVQTIFKNKRPLLKSPPTFSLSIKTK
jgi:hypothetical protein